MDEALRGLAEVLDQTAASPKLALIPIGLLLVAILGVIVSRRSARTGRRSLRLAERQEERKAAFLDVRLISATCVVDERERAYVYDVVIRNPSDRPNSIAEAELWIEYCVGGSRVNVKAPWRRNQKSPPAGDLVLPLDIDANKSRAGSLQIRVDASLLEGRSVERLRLVLTDTFGTDFPISTEFVQERVSDAEELDD